MPHDAPSQEKALQLCLQADKKPVGFLLGAGCPLSVLVPNSAGETDPLIPDIAGLTDFILSKLEAAEVGTDNDNPYAAVLAALKKICTEDGVPKANVEHFLNVLRRTSAVKGCQEVRGILPEQAESLDKAICRLIHEKVSAELPNKTTAYHALARWVRGTSRSEPIEIFTPNYDLLFEQAFEECATPYFDGFVGSRRAFLDSESMERGHQDGGLPLRWTRLWKMHGSINWHRGPNGDVWRESGKGEGELLIYPSHNKVTQSRKLPFLAMQDRLKAFLSKPGAVLVTCGYSYADDHFNTIIRERLRANPQLVVFALIYGDVNATHAAATDELTNEPNFLLLGKASAFVRGKLDDWNAGQTFGLGDFAKLGVMLSEISGSQQPAPPSNAE